MNTEEPADTAESRNVVSETKASFICIKFKTQAKLQQKTVTSTIQKLLRLMKTIKWNFNQKL